MKMIVIADDFTGANDTGVQLAKKGARTEIALNDTVKPSIYADVQVINTESRALSPEHAKQKIQAVLSTFLPKKGDAFPPLIYKKIDSTFRGNVGAEIDAALNISGAQIALVAAAIPAAGRTTLNGQCLVNNVPLIETEFASDPKTPITSSHIKTLIGLQSQYSVHEIYLDAVRSGNLISELNNIKHDTPCIVVMDAELDSDLTLITDAMTKLAYSYLLVGAAGLANALPIDSYLMPKKKLPVLVVAGSMSEATHKQINFAQKVNSLGIVDINVESLLQMDSDSVIEEITQQAVSILRQKQHCVLQTNRDINARHAIDELCQRYHYSRQQLGDKISKALGEITFNITGLSQIGGLFLTGGDTAIAVANALDAEGYRIKAEVVPCVPCGTFINSKIDDLPIITKAGGFGGETTLRDALYYIEEKYSEK